MFVMVVTLVIAVSVVHLFTFSPFHMDAQVSAVTPNNLVPRSDCRMRFLCLLSSSSASWKLLTTLDNCISPFRYNFPSTDKVPTPTMAPDPTSSRPPEWELNIEKALNRLEDSGIDMAEVARKYGKEGIPFRADKHYSQRGFLRPSTAPASSEVPSGFLTPQKATTRSSSANTSPSLPSPLPKHLLEKLHPTDFNFSSPDGSDNEKGPDELIAKRPSRKESKQQAPPADKEEREKDVAGLSSKALDSLLLPRNTKGSKTSAARSPVKVQRQETWFLNDKQRHGNLAGQVMPSWKSHPQLAHAKDASNRPSQTQMMTPAGLNSKAYAYAYANDNMRISANAQKEALLRRDAEALARGMQDSPVAGEMMVVNAPGKRMEWINPRKDSMDWNINGQKIGSEAPVEAKAVVPNDDWDDDWEILYERPGERKWEVKKGKDGRSEAPR